MMRTELTMAQMENVTGGMYHGYARPGSNNIIAGMPPHNPNGVMGPGLGHPSVYTGPQYQNPMIELQKREAERGAHLLPGNYNYNLNC